MIMHMNGFFAAHSDLDVDAPLYRIMPKKHLEQLLRTNTLYFRKVALWDDTWEVPSKFWKSTGKDVSYSKIELANISQKDLYGTCWTDDIDSDAMWRIYSYYKDGIAIQTTIRKLFQSIDFSAFLIDPNFVDGFIGPVRYENIDGNVFFDDKSYQYPEYMVPSYIKRNAFAHEKEIRFLLCAPNYLEFHPTNELGITSDSSGLHLPLLGNGFIEKLILDPRLTEEEVPEFHHALDAYGINMEKSSLYAVPTSTCNLLLSKDQCQPYYPNGRQCWDMKRRDFVTGKESVP